MTDILLEIFRAVIVAGICWYLFLSGRKESSFDENGWAYLKYGFILVFFGMLIDITDNFDSLNRFVIIGDTPYQAFLEKVVGYLIGFILIAIGFMKWLPSVIQLADTKRELEDSLATIEKEIFERKNVESKLQASHKRFLKVLNSIDATIYVADLNTYEILFMNKNMIENFGRDMVGELCWNLFRNESGPCVNCTNHQLINDNAMPDGVCVWQGQNPINQKWYINYDRAIEWTDGRLVKLQIATDITEFKKMEDELRHAHKIESIGTLAGGVAHHFNNILSIILGNTELALGDPHNWGRVNKNLQEIKIASLRAKDIVAQLLTFSRKTGQENIPLDICPVVIEAVKLIKSTIPSSIEIHENIPDTCDAILGDSSQIHHIVINLCSNSAHAMSEGIGILKIGLEKHTLHNPMEGIPGNMDMVPGEYLELIVSDTGSGIDIKNKDKIFDPYFTTKGVGEGTGMGLSIVYGIVKNLNGHIWVDSKLGAGTKTHIFFPVSSEQPQRILKAEFEGQSHGTETVLFIDDDESIVDMTDKILKKMGYKVVAKSNPIKALELFRENPDNFDLVITDMTMPQMTGAELSEKVKRIKSDIPVIICTGHSSLIDDEQSKKLGIADYVMKPVSMSELAKVIRNVFLNKP